MKKVALILFLIMVTGSAAFAAPSDTSDSWVIDAAEFKNLSAALTSPATAGKTIVVSKPMVINSVTLTGSRLLKVIQGGRIDIAPGQRLTFGPDSGYDWGEYQVFGGSGSVAGLRETRPEHWGAKINDFSSSVANSTAINKMYAAAYGATIRYSTGTYYHTGITIPSKSAGYRSRGEGRLNTILLNVGTGHNITITSATERGVSNGFYDFAEMSIRGNGGQYGVGATGLDGIHADGIAIFTFKDLDVSYNGGHGIYLGTSTNTAGSYSGSIINCNIQANKLDNIWAAGTSVTDQKNGILIAGNNIAYAGRNGISTWGTGISISGENTIQGNTGLGVSIDANYVSGVSSSGPISIDTNYFEANKGGDILVRTAVGKVITGLTITHNYMLFQTDVIDAGVDTCVKFVSTGFNQVWNLDYGYNYISPTGARASSVFFADFGGYLAASCNVHLGDYLSGTATDFSATYGRFKNYGAAKVNGVKSITLNGWTQAKGGANITYAAMEKSNNITTTTGNIIFPLSLPLGANIIKIAIPVSTDDGNSFTVQAVIQTHGESTGSYTDFVNIPVVGSSAETAIQVYVGGAKVITQDKIDCVLRVYIARAAALGTFFYLGNPTVYYN
jgi:hypothetical protein